MSSLCHTMLKFSRTQSRMSALSLYVTTCRMVLLSSSDDGGAWADIHRLLSYLRQAVSCSVCGSLLMIPMSPTASTCQHNVCKSCIGGTKRLKPSCSWCKDYNKYTENTHLRILLQCYKKLCNYLLGTNAQKKWGSLNCGTTVSFTDIIEEGVAFSDDYVYSGTLQRRHGNILGIIPDIGSDKLKSKSLLKKDAMTISRLRNAPNAAETNGDSKQPVTNGVSSLYSVALTNNRTKITIRRSSDSSTTENQVFDGAELPAKQKRCDREVLTTQTANTMPRTTKPKRRGCRCGLATPNPGKLTCCGQRCPCYGEGKPCTECKCRGCRNPHKSSIDEGHVMQTSIHIPELHGGNGIIEPCLQVEEVHDPTLNQILVTEVRTEDDNSDVDIEG